MKAYAVSENASEWVREEKQIQKMSLEKRLTAVNSLHLGNTTCFFFWKIGSGSASSKTRSGILFKVTPVIQASYYPPTAASSNFKYYIIKSNMIRLKHETLNYSNVLTVSELKSDLSNPWKYRNSMKSWSIKFFKFFIPFPSGCAAH